VVAVEDIQLLTLVAADQEDPAAADQAVVALDLPELQDKQILAVAQDQASLVDQEL
tara:strand:- start:260 stop:427 length:168 start_codon:yes stop_codon:yes gene_type:complete